MLSESTLSRAHATFHELCRMRARSVHRGAIEEVDGVCCTATGLPSPNFNPALVTRRPADPAGAAARVRAFACRQGVPVRVYAVGSAAEVLRPYLEAAGLTADETIPGLLLSPLPEAAPPAPPGLTIHPIETPAALRLFNDTLAEAFGARRALLDPFDDPRQLALPDLRFYLGYADGRPVATASRFSSHGIAGVYTVGTIPAYRRQGVGEAMTWHAALDGSRGQCFASYLQPSPLGLRLYTRLGYRRAVEYLTWVGRFGSA